MKQIQKGFTLIELMIVVAIIGILAAVAIPAYQDYVVKSKLAKVISSIDSIKTAIALHFQEMGSFPPSTTQVNVSASGAVTGIWNTMGISEITLPNEVKQLGYMTNNNGDLYGLSMVFQNIKATSINDQAVMMTPVIAGQSVTSTGAMTLGGSGVGAGITSLPSFFVCSPNLDTVAKKFFNNSGAICPAP